MIHSMMFLALTLLTRDVDAKKAEPPIQPVANQHELMERIFATGGDSETTGGFIILVSLSAATDEDFKLLKDLKGVKYLDCAHCKTDGTGLASISQMKRLEKLLLNGNAFKDKYLRHISDFPRLRILWLQDTPITDCGLRYIRSLKSLEDLNLENTKITDKGLKYLHAMKKLKTLNLDGTCVTRNGIKDLQAHLPKTQIWGAE